MKKSLLVVCTAITILAVFQSSTNAPKSLLHASGSSVTSYITSTKNCTSCHSKAVSGGSITIQGLPSTVIAGQSYTVSVHINDATTSAANWGFVMAVPSGKITTTNTLVGIKSGSLICYHSSPAVLTDTAYSFKNITWTAPATAGTVSIVCNGLAGNNNGGSSGDHSYTGTTTVTVALPTPVKIASFDAALIANKVNLNWSSASEVNAESFIVERGGDGIDFSAAGTIKAIGNSSNLHAYSFSENAAALSGTVYYRLKIVDKNGATSYSDVKSVSIKAIQSSIVSIYPNPLRAGQDLKIRYVAVKSDKVTFSLINSEGKRVSNIASNVNEGTNELSLSVGHLTPGTYYLSTNNSGVKKQAVIVQ